MNDQKPLSPRALALARAQGSDARYEGKDRDDDQPYDSDALATAWDEGWERADDERRLERTIGHNLIEDAVYKGD